MEYIVKIIREERSKNKQFWRYTFIDVKTGKENWFIRNCQINYISGLIGRLKLDWDENRKCNLYRDFSQNIADLKETEEEEDLGLWEEKFEKKIQQLESKLIHEPPKLFKTHEKLIEYLNKEYKDLSSWEKVAFKLEKPSRTLRRWRKKVFRPQQKKGPKFKIDRKSFYHLVLSLQNEEAGTLKEVSQMCLW
ncbi:hypothetical protein [endosymbiont GvMRE of Glomus versiforme]|uniref:hypothetical protein n=1 Tax=endosymbiont GvMRE of Glomus versiforme TaxID=2039283 RepID=UPI000EE38F81|nr:hypothetical protein [endosymbiont GvMRE of Glomus versiforme]RHZ37187.1 Transposase [endosymbiont GvMRE of Glomus versiforme]